METLVAGSYGILCQVEPARRRRVAELAAKGLDRRTTDERHVRWLSQKARVPEVQAHAEAEKRRLASERAPRTDLEMRLDGTSVATHALGDSALWAAAFSTRIEDEALTAVLSGRCVAIDSIALKLITDLAAELGEH